jgi:hypothetical protein
MDKRKRLIAAGRLMQAELEPVGLTEEELSADFKAWRSRRRILLRGCLGIRLRSQSR